MQFTDEGYRLVRCAIGDGAVPIAAMLDLFRAHHAEADARCWSRARWRRGMCASCGRNGGRFYPPQVAHRRSPPASPRRSVNRLADDADYRTPWETGEDGAIADYELAMIRRSAANMRALGLERQTGD